MCIFFAFVKYSVRVATNHLSRPHQPSSAVLHFSISFRHYSQWEPKLTIYSTNIQNEDDKETISGSTNLEIREIHVATEQKECLVDNIFIIRCHSNHTSTTIRDVGTGATPRIALRNGSIAHPQHTSHASSFLLDPTAGYEVNPTLCIFRLPLFGIAFKMDECQFCQKWAIIPLQGTGTVSLNKQGSLYHRNLIYSATECR